jgi:hypothetical protein
MSIAFVKLAIATDVQGAPAACGDMENDAITGGVLTATHVVVAAGRLGFPAPFTAHNR